MGGILKWFQSAAGVCPSCHGKGVFPEDCRADHIVTCPTCHGKQKVQIKKSVMRSEELPCDQPGCTNGKVLQPDGKGGQIYVDCPVCNGLNRVIRNIEETWETEAICPTCEGVGVVSAKRLCDLHEQVLCPTCHGSGLCLDKKKIALIAGGVLLVFLMPPVAAVALLFGSLVFSVKVALKKKKSK